MVAALRLPMDTFEALLASWCGLALAVALVLLAREEIPRGSKRSNRSRWAVDTRVGWVLKEAPGTLQLLYWFLRPAARPAPIARVFLAAYLLHYIYRIAVYPMLLRTRGSKNISVENLLHTAWFHGCNEGLLGYWLTVRCDYSITWLTDPRFWVGWVMFAIGFAVCVSHDCFLIALRQRGDARGIIRVPEGGLNDFVANGNYLGECVEWLGFAVMTWSGPGFAFALWSCANLFPTAIANHRWYRRELKDKYPLERRAILPFVL